MLSFSLILKKAMMWSLFQVVNKGGSERNYYFQIVRLLEQGASKMKCMQKKSR